jgi:hydrogenase maturation protein HypF
VYCYIVKGKVQGVGFRPFIVQACRAAGIKGYVQNAGSHVKIDVDNPLILEKILKTLPGEMRIDTYEKITTPDVFDDFTIRESQGEGYAEIPPDLYLCEDCQKEMGDAFNRRHNYYFTTCARCGPRYSITRHTPYDRQTTSMSEFAMCHSCAREYAQLDDRRYHAQTIACPHCGPILQLLERGSIIVDDARRAIDATAKLLLAGEVVAIKGVGGFHWACLTNPTYVNTLRAISGRPHKPYAILCRDMNMVQQIAHVSMEEERLLCSPARPIVVLRKKQSFPGVSELDTVGVILPYSALHVLLSESVNEPIVLTSANLPNEPITTHAREQVTRYILNHTRQIINPIDDSVMKIIGDKKLFLRRSRGFVPEAIPLASQNDEIILAMGGDTNAAFAVYDRGKAIISPYLGNLSHAGALQRYQQTISTYLERMKIRPTIIAGDAHPSYVSHVLGKSMAEEWGLPFCEVFHHDAHACAVMGEHGLSESTSIVCDGNGYGKDGTSWGGEVFFQGKRAGHLEPQLQLGGDSAVYQPGKMAYSILRKFLTPEKAAAYIAPIFSEKEIHVLEGQWDQRFNTPPTTSTGRILDAASYVLGYCTQRTYDGRPALLLESRSTSPYPFSPIIENNVLQTTPLFEFLIQNSTREKSRLAATVQQYIAQGLSQIAQSFGGTYTFSGGCAYNRIMTSYLLQNDFRVNEKLPCGDGGLSFGQIAYVLANPGSKHP